MLNEFFLPEPVLLKFYQGAGCAECGFSGYKGRMIVADLWVPDDQDAVTQGTKKELIEGDSHEHVKGSRKEKIGGPLALTVGGDRAEAVGGAQHLQIRGDRNPLISGPARCPSCDRGASEPGWRGRGKPRRGRPRGPCA